MNGLVGYLRVRISYQNYNVTRMIPLSNLRGQALFIRENENDEGTYGFFEGILGDILRVTTSDNGIGESYNGIREYQGKVIEDQTVWPRRGADVLDLDISLETLGTKKEIRKKAREEEQTGDLNTTGVIAHLLGIRY